MSAVFKFSASKTQAAHPAADRQASIQGESCDGSAQSNVLLQWSEVDLHARKRPRAIDDERTGAGHSVRLCTPYKHPTVWHVRLGAKPTSCGFGGGGGRCPHSYGVRPNDHCPLAGCVHNFYGRHATSRRGDEDQPFGLCLGRRDYPERLTLPPHQGRRPLRSARRQDEPVDSAGHSRSDAGDAQEAHHRHCAEAPPQGAQAGEG